MGKSPWWMLAALGVLVVDAGMDAANGEIRDAVKTLLIVVFFIYVIRRGPAA